MTDADTVREALEIAGLYPINWRSHKFAALFALDRLEAERDAAREKNRLLWTERGEILGRAQDAEAERDRLREALDDANSAVSDETVAQLRASGWSEEKIRASMIRAVARKDRRLTYPPPADSQPEETT